MRCAPKSPVCDIGFGLMPMLPVLTAWNVITPAARSFSNLAIRAGAAP